jgi:hypothetical protein
MSGEDTTQPVTAGHGSAVSCDAKFVPFLRDTGLAQMIPFDEAADE